MVTKVTLGICKQEAATQTTFSVNHGLFYVHTCPDMSHGLGSLNVDKLQYYCHAQLSVGP